MTSHRRTLTALTLPLLLAAPACRQSAPPPQIVTAATATGASATSTVPLTVSTMPAAGVTSTVVTVAVTQAEEWLGISQALIDADWQLSVSPGATAIESVYTATSPQLSPTRVTVAYLIANGQHAQGPPNKAVRATVADRRNDLVVLSVDIEVPSVVSVLDATGAAVQTFRNAETDRQRKLNLTIQKGATGEWKLHDLVLLDKKES